MKRTTVNQVIVISAVTVCAIATTALITLTIEEITRIKQVKKINKLHMANQERATRLHDYAEKVMNEIEFHRIIEENNL